MEFWDWMGLIFQVACWGTAIWNMRQLNRQYERTLKLIRDLNQENSQLQALLESKLLADLRRTPSKIDRSTQN